MVMTAPPCAPVFSRKPPDQGPRPCASSVGADSMPGCWNAGPDAISPNGRIHSVLREFVKQGLRVLHGIAPRFGRGCDVDHRGVSRTGRTIGSFCAVAFSMHLAAQAHEIPGVRLRV